MIDGIRALSAADLGRAEEVLRFLAKRGTFGAKPLQNGLFPAGGTTSEALQPLEYHYVWVRDNVHIAHWLSSTGRRDAATRTMRALCRYFSNHQRRFLDIIEKREDPRDAMVRPHVRFDGATLREVDQRWSHKQNDALGYFLWLACDLLLDSAPEADPRELATLALFPRFFDAIRYWEDEDSGHWEEEEKVQASSIGVVLAGVRALRRLQEQPRLADAFAEQGVSPAATERLDVAGSHALSEILPSECIQPGKERRYDAALLFLIYPTQLVGGPVAERILGGVRKHLQGEIGISRYHGDTFWSPNYKEVVPPEERTGQLTGSSGRNRLTVRRGEEAQWCLFDSILSTIYGRRYLQERADQDLELQVEYLNRALGQLTSPSTSGTPYRCPEAYYLVANRWVPNDATPLLWAEANLDLALRQAIESAAVTGLDA